MNNWRAIRVNLAQLRLLVAKTYYALRAAGYGRLRAAGILTAALVFGRDIMPDN
jgi:hypothetical protein